MSLLKGFALYAPTTVSRENVMAVNALFATFFASASSDERCAVFRTFLERAVDDLGSTDGFAEADLEGLVRKVFATANFDDCKAKLAAATVYHTHRAATPPRSPTPRPMTPTRATDLSHQTAAANQAQMHEILAAISATAARQQNQDEAIRALARQQAAQQEEAQRQVNQQTARMEETARQAAQQAAKQQREADDQRAMLQRILATLAAAPARQSPAPQQWAATPPAPSWSPSPAFAAQAPPAQPAPPTPPKETRAAEDTPQQERSQSQDIAAALASAIFSPQRRAKDNKWHDLSFDRSSRARPGPEEIAEANADTDKAHGLFSPAETDEIARLRNIAAALAKPQPDTQLARELATERLMEYARAAAEFNRRAATAKDSKDALRAEALKTAWPAIRARALDSYACPGGAPVPPEAFNRPAPHSYTEAVARKGLLNPKGLPQPFVSKDSSAYSPVSPAGPPAQPNVLCHLPVATGGGAACRTPLRGGAPQPAHPPAAPPPAPPTAQRPTRPRQQQAAQQEETPLSKAEVRRRMAATPVGTHVAADWRAAGSTARSVWMGVRAPRGVDWTHRLADGRRIPLAAAPVSNTPPAQDVDYFAFGAADGPQLPEGPPAHPNQGGLCAVNAVLSALWPAALASQSSCVAFRACNADSAKQAFIDHVARKAGLRAQPGRTDAVAFLRAAVATLPAPEAAAIAVAEPPPDTAARSLPAGACSGIFFRGPDPQGHWVALVRVGARTWRADDATVEEATCVPHGFALRASLSLVSPSFPLGPALPARTAMTGDLATIAPKNWKDLPQMVRRGVSHEQRCQHALWIQRLLAAARARPEPVTPAALAVEVVSSMAASNGWAPQTVLKHLCSIQGALARLSQYTNATWNCTTASDPAWRDALRAQRYSTNQRLPTQAVPLTQEQVLEATAAMDTDVAAATILAWATTARLGCVLQLQRSNVVLAENVVTVTFVRGKRAHIKGPYTVTAALHPQWTTLLRGFLANKLPTDWLWPAASTAQRRNVANNIVTQLREATACPEAESRSLRRGSIHHLAATGASEADLLLFTGHCRVDTLMRYLNHGRVPSERTTRMTKASTRALQQPAPA